MPINDKEQPGKSPLDSISLLARRDIEARIVAHLIDAFGEEFGREQSLQIASRVIRDIAREQGEQLAKNIGGCTLHHFAQAIEAWKADDALQMDVIQQDEGRLDFNVVRCLYAELYSRLGIRELGVLLSCNRDEALIEGFNPQIRLDRTQTIMEGAPYCDFRFTRK